MPYTKANNILLYVHKRSNHPPRIIENIPQSINKRPSEISLMKIHSPKPHLSIRKTLDDSGYYPTHLSIPTYKVHSKTRKPYKK